MVVAYNSRQSDRGGMGMVGSLGTEIHMTLELLKGPHNTDM